MVLPKIVNRALLFTGRDLLHSRAEYLGIGKTEFIDTLLDITHTEDIAFGPLELLDYLILKPCIVLILIYEDLRKLLTVERRCFLRL